MGILNPGYLFLLTIIGAFILLYFFRKQFESKVISSNLLWEEVMNEWQAAPWFDKMQKNILFWLQLFALLLLLLALLRPFTYADGVKGEEQIFVVDTSATLSAIVNGETIFAANQLQMKAIIDKLNNQPVTIITAGKQPQIVARFETNKRKLATIIDGLTISYDQENFDTALQLARGLATSENSAIHIFSDGLEEEFVANILRDRFVQVHNIQSKINNLSLRSFGVGKENDMINAVALVKNETSEQAKVTFLVEAESGKLYEEDVTIAAGEEQYIHIENLPQEKYYRATILAEDDYSLDNHWTAVFSNSEPAVYTIGNVNPFFIKGFESVGVKITQLNNISQLPKDDFIVLTDDRNLLNDQTFPIIFVDSSSSLVNLTEKITQKDDSLLHYVSFDEIYIRQANKEKISELDSVVSSGKLALIQKGMKNGQPIVALLFPINESDWPLHPSFPIFLYNSYQWMSQQTSYLGYFEPGEEKWVNIGGLNQEIEIFSETGENIYSIKGNENFIAPNQPGLYQAVTGSNIYYFSVLLNEKERSVKFAESYIVNEQILDSGGKTRVIDDNFWFWFVVLAVILLFIEWEVYRRRA